MEPLIASAPVSSRTTDEKTGIRWYECNGNRYISVTSVLDCFVEPQLKAWLIKNTPKAIETRKTETAGQGSLIHQQAHEGSEDRFNVLMKEKGMESLASEFVVISKNGWAGQADRLVSYQGKRYILDIKTGRFGPKAGAQLGGYSLAANEAGMNVEGIAVVSLPRDLSKPAQMFDYSAHYEECQYSFCAAFDFWKHQNYKGLLEWPFFEIKTVLSYQWGFGK